MLNLFSLNLKWEIEIQIVKEMTLFMNKNNIKNKNKIITLGDNLLEIRSSAFGLGMGQLWIILGLQN